MLHAPPHAADRSLLFTLRIRRHAEDLLRRRAEESGGTYVTW